jgi:hypothetical protein
MHFTSVKSSNLDAVHYDPGTRVLTVKFKNGSTYSHSECLPQHHAGLLAAESAGKYYNLHIRGKLAHQKHENA